MAKHKPRRPKKNKIKKEIELTFQTPKKVFANGLIVNQKKLELYDKVSLEEIISEMQLHGIYVQQEDILDQYEKCYSTESLIQFYHQQFKHELDELEKSTVLFDDDCFILYIQKLIKEKYNSWEVPDPDNIFDYLEAIDNHENPKHLSIYLSILKNINRMKDYQKTNVLKDIFKGTLYDPEAVLSDIIMHTYNIYIDHPDLQTTISLIADELFQLVEIYELDLPEQIYEDACGLLAMNGYPNVKQKFEEGLIKYPNHKIRLHNGIIHELHFYAVKHNEYEDFINIYDKAMKLYPVNEDEREIQSLIKENFEQDIKEIIR